MGIVESEDSWRTGGEGGGATAAIVVTALNKGTILIPSCVHLISVTVWLLYVQGVRKRMDPLNQFSLFIHFS